ncbi:uncharacterized protein LOC128682154 [Plodia interpunctella]|uniref:uncharacterized protein LOC128682154 n=1 Tax=Plodia interpunctella TaxID=58824 RepID=UPI002368E5A3|nr:uncharacterized protein LOC128682154 [Plodia interpunctella]
MSDENIVVVKKAKSEPLPPPRKKKKLHIPRRAPSVVIPPREPIYPSPDKNTCAECPCFPKEDPYVKPKKLNPCLHTPLTLYELAAAVVEELSFPIAFTWSEDDVVNWISNDLGMPQYRECIIDNHINGLRLLMLEDPSRLPLINIHYFDDIKIISEAVHKLFSTDFIKFARSVGLPIRYPLTNCTWFKSRTGPSWGIRKNWTRLDILRWMKIVMPAPVYRDHWDLVWYQKPDFPKVMFARLKEKHVPEFIPRYRPPKDMVCHEYQVPRKFRFQTGIPDEEQLIWVEFKVPPPKPKSKKKKKEKPKRKKIIPKETNLMPKKIDPTGLKGKEFILARRLMPKQKFAVRV